MPLYAVSVINHDSKIYDGYREIKEGEMLGDTESLIVYDLNELSDWTPQEKALTCREKLVVLTKLVRSLPVDNRAGLIGIASAIKVALQADDLELAVYLLNQAKLAENVDTLLLDTVSQILGNE